MLSFEGIKVFCRTKEEYDEVQSAMLGFGGKWQDSDIEFVEEFPKRAFLFLDNKKQIIWSDYTKTFIESNLEEINPSDINLFFKKQLFHKLVDYLEHDTEIVTRRFK